MRLFKLATIVGLTILTSGLAMAGVADQQSKQAENSQGLSKQGSPTLEFDMNTSYKVLDHAIDLWHDAVLKDNRKQMLHRSNEIDDILVENIQSNRLQIKMLVRQMEVANRNNSFEGRNLVGNDQADDHLAEYRELLPRLSGMIVTKEELYRAISRTETFSNKYRLLGDYKSLLRRELKMPGLNLVEIPQVLPERTAKDK